MRPTRFLPLCCLAAALPAAARAESPPTNSDPVAPAVDTVPDEFLRLFEQLDAENYDVRLAAEQRLYLRSIAAVPHLEQAAHHAPPGTLTAVLRLLERMWIEGCPDVADAAEQALERLAFADTPDTAHRARSILSGNHRLRLRRAVAAIREAGGRVEFLPLASARGNVFFGPGGDGDFPIPGQEPVTIHVWLLRTWQGGDDALWHLSRLEDAWSARLWKLEITNVRGSGVKQDAVQALAARIPHLTVDERGASLGIWSGPTGDCQITAVLPNGAAAQAGLQQGDIVRQLNDIPISTFSDLVGNLLDFEPDQQVILKVERGGELLNVPVTLGGWHNLNVNGPAQVSPPLLPELKQP